MSYVAFKTNVSFHTVKRIIDMVNYSTPNYLPEVISIDEFKGNSESFDYHCIIVDPVNHKVIDIIKDRKFHVFCSYFRKIKNRDKVKYVIIDMWKPYIDIVKTFFKNATIIIDKFHFVCYNTLSNEGVRKRISHQIFF